MRTRLQRNHRQNIERSKEEKKNYDEICPMAGNLSILYDVAGVCVCRSVYGRIEVALRVCVLVSVIKQMSWCCFDMCASVRQHSTHILRTLMIRQTILLLLLIELTCKTELLCERMNKVMHTYSQIERIQTHSNSSDTHTYTRTHTETCGTLYCYCPLLLLVLLLLI